MINTKAHAQTIPIKNKLSLFSSTVIAAAFAILILSSIWIFSVSSLAVAALDNIELSPWE